MFYAAFTKPNCILPGKRQINLLTSLHTNPFLSTGVVNTRRAG
jgi:hypothetical protein